MMYECVIYFVKTCYCLLPPVHCLGPAIVGACPGTKTLERSGGDTRLFLATDNTGQGGYAAFLATDNTDQGFFKAMDNIKR